MLSTKNQNVLESLKKAINESKKPFKDLPQSAIYSYLKSANVNKGDYDEIYSELLKYYNPVSSTPSSKIEVKPMSKSAVVYSQDPKERTPRKSVFGKIKQI